jgi:chorismate mutase/prephenate dehydratase
MTLIWTDKFLGASKMDLQDYRAQIDKVDDELLRLFKERMDISRQISQFKKEHSLPLLDAAREREKLAGIGEKAGDEIRSYAHILYTTMFELSRAHQWRFLNAESDLNRVIKDALEHTERVFPQHALAACQGVEGAYSQIACDRLFTDPNILYFTGFDGVFSAIRDDLCQYGVLPLENSTAGAVNMA